jgi:hypothetical protein
MMILRLANQNCHRPLNFNAWPTFKNCRHHLSLRFRTEIIQSRSPQQSRSISHTHSLHSNNSIKLRAFSLAPRSKAIIIIIFNSHKVHKRASESEDMRSGVPAKWRGVLSAAWELEEFFVMVLKW